MSLFLITLGVVVSFFVNFFYKNHVPTYKGKLTDHFDGKRFSNLEGPGMGDFVELIKHNLSNKRGTWEYQEESAGHNEVLDNFNEKGQVRYYHINHATVLIQMDGVNIITDPVFIERASPFRLTGPKRYRKPGIPIEMLPRIDLVLLSHDHYDHLDITSLIKLKDKDNPMIFVGLGLKGFLAKSGLLNVQEFDWHENTLYNDLQITFTPTIHWSNRAVSPRKSLWGGFMINGSVNVYFVGDTAYGNFLKEIKDKYEPIDLAFIPIGAYIPRSFMLRVHMDPQQAAIAHEEIGANESYAIHWGTFPLTYEGLLDPVEELDEACQEKGITTFNYDLIAGTERIYKKYKEVS